MMLLLLLFHLSHPSVMSLVSETVVTLLFASRPIIQAPNSSSKHSLSFHRKALLTRGNSCHIEWHIEAGLTATFIEAADKLKNNVPLDHKLSCIAAGMKTEGNAAGNTKNVLDLTGANTDVPLENNGATYDKNGKKWWSVLFPRKRSSHFDFSEE